MPDSSPSSKLLNRELSWLEFNQRVLGEALDPSIPLLERLRFLAITGSNLDEFFMVRVGGLKLMVQQGANRQDASGMTAAEQLSAISERAHLMQKTQYECLIDEIEPALAEVGVKRAVAADLSDLHLKAIRHVFETETNAVLSPMAVDPNNFPLLVNHTVNVLVRLAEGEDGEPRFAILPLFRSARFLTLQSGNGYTYILLEDIVSLLVERFFPGEVVHEATPFRITRNADISVREDQAPDLMTGMEEVLDARTAGACVRLQVSNLISEQSLEFLRSGLDVSDDDIFHAPGPLGLSDLMQLANLRGFDELKYHSWDPQPSPQVDMTASMFETITKKDVVLYHPYDSFDPVVKLIEEAAVDPDVLAIKQTLYRTSRVSRVVEALERAAANGKNVTVIVELKARFDEARNIDRARKLEQSGVQVIYGVKGLKTHAKICIIVRREPHGVQRYMHFGTGNYNESTARLYSDVSFLTADNDLGADATAFFNAITGYSQPQQFRKIEMAPLGLRQRILELIESETRRKREGQPAGITAKLNSLVDPRIIDALYTASQAGVPVRLNVRGICCLRPGVPALSENIEVISIIDRFLEHARIFHFVHGGEDRLYISSADWMPRNLDRRIELLTPIDDSASKQRMIEILDVHFQDNVKARSLQTDGGYTKPQSDPENAVRSQEAIYTMTKQAVKNAVRWRQLVFETHQAPHGKD